MSRDAPLFTPDEVRALLAKEESQFLDFKSLLDHDVSPPVPLDRRKVRDWIAEYVAAFANADGGTLLLGIDDDGTPSGHRYPEEAIADFVAVPERRLRVPVSCRIQRLQLDGQEILIFDVPMSVEAVMVEGDGFPCRINDQVVHQPQEVINARKEAYRRVGWEQRIRAEATFDDLDLDLARKFLGATVLGKRPVEETLERFGLIVARARAWAVTNAALLLFGKPPLVRWHPHADVRYFRVEGIEREHGAQRNVAQLDRVELPLARSLPEAMRVASAQIRRSEKLHDLFFKETPEYPDFAWQEALVNAIAHRDYEIQSQSIEVWFYSDRMEVKSPGELVPPVTLEGLRSRAPVHASRNPLIVRVLVEAGLMREEGEGIPRIFDEMEHSFLRAPQFAVEHGMFRVTLLNVPVFEGPSPEWQRLVSGLSLSTNQKRVLLAHPDRFTNEDYRRLSQIDRDEAYREIQDLVNRGIVSSPATSGRGAAYRISPDLHRTRTFLEARLPRLREHFGRSERLTNAGYRAHFAVTRSTARDELQRLVAAGCLRLEGSRRGAHYLALPALLGPARK